MVLPILNMKWKKSVYIDDSTIRNFSGLPWFFSFLWLEQMGQRTTKKICLIEADKAELIVTLHTFKFAVQLLLFAKQGEYTSLLRSRLCAVYVWNISQG